MADDAGKGNEPAVSIFPFWRRDRRCIGESFAWAEGILLLATLARKWKLELVPEQKIGLQPMITLTAKVWNEDVLRRRN